MKLNNIQAHVSSPHSNLNLEELQTTILSRARSLSETALKVLLWERDKLTLEQRFIEDEIAKCDQRIKNIKGDWKLQLETILKSCNEAYPRGSLQKSYDKSACQSNKRLKPLPSTKSMCRDLTTKLFLALRKLRSLLVKECPGGVMGTYIFTNPTLQKISTKIPRNKEELLEIEGLGKDKVSRYGDRLLETIESTIKEYYATNKKSSME
uniref:HRDC domain-containing protein n=1 Tax=Brassica campestris TaxID=3711 RepID=M4EUG5_BRACM